MSVIEVPELGWEPDPASENHLDWPAADLLAASAPADGVDLVDLMPKPLSQSRGGSCVLQAVAVAVHAAHRRQGVSRPEVMGIMRPWFLCRREAGLQTWNVGTYIRRAARIVREAGFSRGVHDPYDWRKYAEPPTPALDRLCADQSKKYATRRGRGPVEFRRLPARSSSRAQDVRLAIAAGFPVVMGWQIPERFKRDSEVDWDKPFDFIEGEEIAGGHAMVLFAALADGSFRGQNSWGPNRHDGGRFIMGAKTVNEGYDPWIFASAPYYSDAA